MSGAVYQWHTGGYLLLTAAQRALADCFVEAHGIPAGSILLDAELVVEVDDDGSFWLRVWQAVTGPGDAYQRCPHCPSCLMQEPVCEPLAAPVPDLPGAFIDRDSGVPVAEPAES